MATRPLGAWQVTQTSPEHRALPPHMQDSIDSLAERAALWLLDTTDTADNFAPRWQALEQKLKRELTKVIVEADV